VKNIHTPASFLELVESGTFIEICNAFNHVHAQRQTLLAGMVEIADPCSLRTGDGFRMIANSAIKSVSPTTTDAGVAG
jgi:hypothetical protein